MARSRLSRGALRLEAGLALLLASCSADRHPVSPHEVAPGAPEIAADPFTEEPAVDPTPRGRDVPMRLEEARKQGGLLFSVSEAPSESERPSTETRVVPADEARAARVLDRLPRLTPSPEDAEDFRKRARGPAPPRAGEIAASFPEPGPPPPPPPPAKPLAIARVQPSGEVTDVPRVTFTFSEPMVSLTSRDAADAGPPPARIDPTPPGRWRWIDPLTLAFEADPRLPKATDYLLTVLEGARAPSGARLAEPFVARFATAPPRVTRISPTGEGVDRRPVVAVAFDQKVVPKAVLSRIRVRAGRSIAIAIAAKEDLAAAPEAASVIASAPPGTAFAFRANEVLPLGARVDIEIGPGVPSAEGPKVSTAAERFSFRTHGPFGFERASCDFGPRCGPDSAFRLDFTNPIEAAFDPGLVRVRPAIPRAEIEAHGRSLIIRGRKRAGARYQVAVGAALRDVHGQRLGREAKVSLAVDPPDPRVFASRQRLVVLPRGARTFPVHSVGVQKLAASLRSVAPSDWRAFVAHADAYGQEGAPPLPGRLLLSREIRVSGDTGSIARTAIDLSPALRDGVGHAIVEVDLPPGAEPKERWRRRRTAALVWVQVTAIGLSAFADEDSLFAWASRLEDGAPLEAVPLSMLPTGSGASTSPDGTARLALPARDPGGGAWLVAVQGGDRAFLPESEWNASSSSWVRRRSEPSYHWFVLDDRRLYRPGEEVHVKGWLRRVDLAKGGDVLDELDEGRKLSFKAEDARGNEITSGEVALGALGDFSLSFELPKTAELGWGRVQLKTPRTDLRREASESHAFQIQEFRRPEFEVRTETSEGPHLVGRESDASVTARYYTSGALPFADTTWRVHAAPAHYAPPNKSDFTFGVEAPWWPEEGREHDGATKTLEGETDADGRHAIRLAFEGVHPPRPMRVSLEATVMDVNRQAWSASASLLVHPSRVYVGIRALRGFVAPGERLEIEAILVDIDGRDVLDLPVDLELLPDDVEGKADPERCRATPSSTPARCAFTPLSPGRYRVRATAADGEGRPAASELGVWVFGPALALSSGLEAGHAEVRPSAESYAPGEVAKVLVISPFSPAEGLLRVQRSGLLRTERFRMESRTRVLEVPIDAASAPNLEVSVDLVGTREEAGAHVPAWAHGDARLRVPPRDRKLALEVAPEHPIAAPGRETSVRILVRDASGTPVEGAGILLFAVDEAVLALGGYALGDPLAAFHPLRGSGTNAYHLRRYVQRDVALGEQAEESMARSMRLSAPAAGLEKGESALFDGEGDPLQLRVNFSPLAVFEPSARTGADGAATVRFVLPDSLTRYRVMAIAAKGARSFGAAESSLTVKKPLMLRPSPPRFLHFGDLAELPVVIENATGRPLTTVVAARATNASLLEPRAFEVEVPPRDRAEVRFTVETERPGTARFQLAAASGLLGDAAELSLPVWTPATEESFARYGSLTEGAVAQSVRAPDDARTELGGLEITTSSTELQALTDAFLYLVRYPYECAEQIASRVVSVAALKDVLGAFEAEGLPSPEEILTSMERDIARLREMQNADGGWPFWRRGGESWPFLSAHVMHALVRAKAKGFLVPGEVLESGRAHLAGIEGLLGAYGNGPRSSLVAYALFVRSLMGDLDGAGAKRLIEQGGGVDRLPLEAVGWLYSVLADAPDAERELALVRRIVDNRATETAGTAHFATSYEEGAHLILHSDRRADGILLEQLLRDRPEHPLVTKIARGLLAHRTKGRWRNTQENAFVLLALERYFHTYEKVTPDFLARAWLGGTFAGEHHFLGRTTERHHIEIPMSFLAGEGGAAELLLAKEGPGRLYYRMGLRYAPRSLELAAADHGFAVSRRYEAVRDEGGVRRDDDGTWRIRAGTLVRVRIEMVARERRHHVALVDPLPAGLEPLNAALHGTTSADRNADGEAGAEILGGEYDRRGFGRWFEHENMRDERVEAFASLLWPGVHRYAYVARATTPGRFVVPPATAEEMYAPETFGRSATDRVRIE